MKVLFITNIPAPYRMNFFEGLGNHIELTVLYEARKARSIKFSYEGISVSTYKEIYLSDGYIKENTPNTKIIAFLLKNKYDLIFLTNYRYFTEMLAYILIKFLKTPYCVEIDGGRIRKEIRITYEFKRWLLNGAKAYFSPAKSADEFFIHYGVNPSKLIRYPFTSITKDYILTPDELSKKIESRKDKPIVFLFVGRLVKEKGVDLLIHAYNELCVTTKVNTKLIIVGNGPNLVFKEYLNQIKNFSTEFRDFVSSKDLIKIYDESDIFVFPSLYDPWGLVINEAMARGLSIITSDGVNSSLELISNFKNGLFFSTSDRLSLLSCMTELISDREIRVSQSYNNINKISEHTIENMIDTHISFIKKLNSK